MPKVSDLIEHINNQYPVLDLTANIVKGVYFLASESDVSEVPVNIQSPNAIAMIAGKPMVYSESEGSSFDSIDSWKEVATYPTDYEELLGIDLVDINSNLLDRYEVILYDSVDKVFKKANLDSIFGGLGFFFAQTYAGNTTLVNPNTGIVGDLNGDGTVGTSDLLALLAAYGTNANEDGQANWVSTKVVVTSETTPYYVNYSAQSYAAGDKLYIDSALTTATSIGNYPLSFVSNVGEVDIDSIDGVNYISISNPQSGVAVLPTLMEELPLIKFWNGYIGQVTGVSFWGAGTTTGPITNMTFGVDVRFFGENDVYGQVGDTISISLNNQFDYNGFAIPNPLVNYPIAISGTNSQVREAWLTLSQNYQIDEIRLNPYIIYDEPTPGSYVESSINQILFTASAFGLEVINNP